MVYILLIDIIICSFSDLIITECSFTITPTEPSIYLIPVAVSYGQQSSDINILTNPDIVSTFSFNETGKLVNSSFCRIASLEVYRGMEQAINISYDGFSLSDKGNIKVR